MGSWASKSQASFWKLLISGSLCNGGQITYHLCGEVYQPAGHLLPGHTFLYRKQTHHSALHKPDLVVLVLNECWMVNAKNEKKETIAWFSLNWVLFSQNSLKIPLTAWVPMSIIANGIRQCKQSYFSPKLCKLGLVASLLARSIACYKGALQH